jgi:hypothetical protein
MPKINNKLTPEQRKRIELEAELQDFHNGEERANNAQSMRNHHGRKYPVLSDGMDRQEAYDLFGEI